VIDGTTLKLYLDGVLKNSTAFSETIQYDASPVFIGADDNDGNGVADYFFNGSIDEVRIYDRALSTEEIKALYQAKAKLNYADIRFYDGSTELSYWKESDGKFWVKVPFIGHNSRKTIWVYYGNPHADGSEAVIGTLEVPGLSCKTIRDHGNRTSGVYFIDPNAGSVSDAFPVYCDMVTGNTAWTLVMKMDGTKNTFSYDSQLWTNTDTYNEDSPDFDTNEAKLKSYSTIPFDAVRLGMRDAANPNDDIDWITINVSANSMYELIGGGSFTATAIGRTAWLGMLEGSCLQLNCNAEGFNTPYNYAKARIGIQANQENNCGSCDSVIGFGLGSFTCGVSPVSVGAGWGCCSPCQDINGNDCSTGSKAAYGWIFVHDVSFTPSNLLPLNLTQEEDIAT